MLITILHILRSCRFLLLVCLILATARVNAAEEKGIAVHPQWLALLHMQHGLAGGYHSEVDAADFFLSGRPDDPLLELQATLQALRNGQTMDGRYAWCRFPARAAFLVQQAELHPPADLSCPELDYWRGRFNTDELVLVYPEPYLKHVASVFGHTFLRFDSADKRRHPVLLSNALSYYADVGSAGGTVSYIADGLAGGFAGVLEVAPYFQKLRRYSDGEDRDIREYRLAYTPAQIRLLVDHLWEVRGHSFNYFFLDENCSYRLISLLDVVTPGHDLRWQFDWHAMPVDTVKALRQRGLVAESVYIPSARKRFQEQLAALNLDQRRQLEALVRNEVHMDDVDDLRVLQLSADYNGLMREVEPARHVSHAQQVSRLVQREQQSGQVLPPEQTRLHAADPIDTGHDMYRVQTGWQHDDGQEFLLLGIRGLEHDLHDPQAGYPRGVQLQALDVVLRGSVDGHREEGGDWQLERLQWFGLGSYSPRDAFFRDPSWGFSVARQRELLGDSRELLHVVDGYRGVSYRCGALLCHAELAGAALGGSSLDLGWGLRAGVQVGLLYQQDDWSWSAGLSRQQHLVGEGDYLGSVSVAGGYRLQRNASLYTDYRHEQNEETVRDVFTVSLRLFF